MKIFLMTTSRTAILATCAALLGVGVNTGAATVIIANTGDRVLRDTDADGNGNSLASLGSTVGQVGEVFQDSDQGRYYLPFGILSQADKDAILNAPADPQSITLNISLGSSANVSDSSVDIYGYTNRAGVTAFGSDFQNLSVTLLHENAVTSASPTVFLSFDITAFAKQEIAVGNSVLAFRFQVNPFESLPNADGLLNRYQFHTADHASNKPFIEVIPEPSTYGLVASLSVLGVALIRRVRGRRRGL